MFLNIKYVTLTFGCHSHIWMSLSHLGRGYQLPTRNSEAGKWIKSNTFLTNRILTECKWISFQNYTFFLPIFFRTYRKTPYEQPNRSIILKGFSPALRSSSIFSWLNFGFWPLLFGGNWWLIRISPLHTIYCTFKFTRAGHFIGSTVAEKIP
jgi:hypothetical protein